MKKLVLFAFYCFLSTNGIADPAAVHGMLLFGNSHVYVSHLPMFHSPHDYQVILEIALEPAAKKVFLDDRKANPEERVYTLVPEKFVLPDMVTHPKPFKATLFRGHFERGGNEILADAKVKIEKVIFFKKLDPEEKSSDTLKYILFGQWGETYMAHLIHGRPNFDQVVQVEVKNVPLSKLLESKPSIIVQVPRMNDEKPVTELRPVIAEKPGDATTNDILVTLHQVYLEYDDLK